jgi:hypothetical protein
MEIDNMLTNNALVLYARFTVTAQCYKKFYCCSLILTQCYKRPQLQAKRLS